MTSYPPLNLLGALLVLAGPLPAAWWLAARARVPPALGAMIWWCVLQSALGTALGSVGLLRPGAVLAAEAVLFVVAGVSLWRGGPSAAREHEPLTWSRLLPFLPAAGLGLGLLACSLGLPVTEHDSLAYHLPTAVTWMQEGWLAPASGLTHYPWGYYPGGWEMISALLMLPVGDDLLATLPSVLAWVVFILSVVALGSLDDESGLQAGPTSPWAGRPMRAAACAGLVGALPITIHAVTTARCDLPTAAFFLAAVLAGLVYRRSRNPYDLALFIVAAGMLPALKPSGFGYAALAGLVLFPWRRIVALRHRAVAASLLVAVFLACVWYVRNLIVAGNPLGVIRVSAFGHVLFDGWAGSERLGRGALVRAFHLGAASDWRELAKVAWEWLGPGFLLLLALVASAPRAFRARRDRVLLGLAGLTFLVYVATPYSAAVYPPYHIGAMTGHQMRFALCFLGLLGVLALRGLRLHGSSVACATALISLGLVGHAIYVLPTPGRLAALLLLWLAVGAAALHRARGRGRRVAVLALGGLSLIPVLLLAGHQRHLTRQMAYGPAFAAANALPPASRVGYLTRDTTMSALAYQLYGEHFQHRLVAVPHLAGAPDGWARELRAQGIELVAVGPFSQGLPPETTAALQQLDRPGSGFLRAAGRDPREEVVLYRVP